MKIFVILITGCAKFKSRFKLLRVAGMAAMSFNGKIEKNVRQ